MATSPELLLDEQCIRDLRSEFGSEVSIISLAETAVGFQLEVLVQEVD